MIRQLDWLNRKFQFDFPVEIFPSILERFRGTPARLEEVTQNLSEENLTFKPEGKWSIKEHTGHLLSLEELGERRFNDYLSGVKVLTAADMSNRDTNESNYNSKVIDEILKQFRTARESLVQKLEKLDEEQASISAFHPRLETQIRIIDWVYFMCEHDDHHLARIREVIRHY